VLAPLLAVEFFVNFIYEELEKHIFRSGSAWQGFVFFSDTLGFQYHPHSIFSLPVEAISSVIAPRLNWLTLTHEISHAVFAAMQLDVAEKNVLEEMVKRLSHREGVDIEEAEYARVRDSFFELFANWFDYYHFFEEELGFYFQCIWESWFAVPFVSKEPNEYIFRSFAIYTLADLDELDAAVFRGNEAVFFATKWNGFVELFRSDLPDTYDRLDFASAKGSSLALAECLVPPFSSLARRYRYEAFKQAVNARYTDADTHVNDLSIGKLPETPIENPLLLIKECRRNPGLSGEPMGDRVSAAMLLAFRNEVYFLDSDESG
jgi:hypothetical protein